MTSPTEAEEAARRIVEHKPNEAGWGYTEDVLAVASAFLPTSEVATKEKPHG
jgi:hypothetical protein